MITKSLHDWRHDPGLRSLAIDMLNQPALQQMLMVLDNEDASNHPRNIRDGAESMFVLGQIYGFKEALRSLRSMAEPYPEPKVPVRADWGVNEADDAMPLPKLTK